MTDHNVSLRGLYERAHQLVIADYRQFIAAHEATTEESATPTGTVATPTGTVATPTGTVATPTGTVATPTGTVATPTEKFANEIIPLLRKKIEDAQRQYELALRNNDTRFMRAFLVNIRATHLHMPEYAFIPKNLPE